jgi:hypothetical protein
MSATCTVHLIALFDHRNIWWRVQIMELLIMHFLHSPVISSLLGSNISNPCSSNC